MHTSSFGTQAEYEAYYSKEARARRREELESNRNQVLTAAQTLYESGDHDGARNMLFNAGIEADYYVKCWGDDS